jgi:hypothetical protein
MDIEKWATRIARVYACICLDKIFVTLGWADIDITMQSGDDSTGDSVFVAKSVPECEDRFSGEEVIRGA